MTEEYINENRKNEPTYSTKYIGKLCIIGFIFFYSKQTSFSSFFMIVIDFDKEINYFFRSD